MTWWTRARDSVTKPIGKVIDPISKGINAIGSAWDNAVAYPVRSGLKSIGATKDNVNKVIPVKKAQKFLANPADGLLPQNIRDSAWYQTAVRPIIKIALDAGIAAVTAGVGAAIFKGASLAISLSAAYAAASAAAVSSTLVDLVTVAGGGTLKGFSPTEAVNAAYGGYKVGSKVTDNLLAVEWSKAAAADAATAATLPEVAKQLEAAGVNSAEATLILKGQAIASAVDLGAISFDAGSTLMDTAATNYDSYVAEVGKISSSTTLTTAEQSTQIAALANKYSVGLDKNLVANGDLSTSIQQSIMLDAKLTLTSATNDPSKFSIADLARLDAATTTTGGIGASIADTTAQLQPMLADGSITAAEYNDLLNGQTLANQYGQGKIGVDAVSNGIQIARDGGIDLWDSSIASGTRLSSLQTADTQGLLTQRDLGALSTFGRDLNMSLSSTPSLNTIVKSPVKGAFYEKGDLIYDYGNVYRVDKPFLLDGSSSLTGANFNHANASLIGDSTAVEQSLSAGQKIGKIINDALTALTPSANAAEIPPASIDLATVASDPRFIGASYDSAGNVASYMDANTGSMYSATTGEMIPLDQVGGSLHITKILSQVDASVAAQMATATDQATLDSLKKVATDTAGTIPTSVQTAYDTAIQALATVDPNSLLANTSTTGAPAASTNVVDPFSQVTNINTTPSTHVRHKVNNTQTSLRPKVIQVQLNPPTPAPDPIVKPLVTPAPSPTKQPAADKQPIIQKPVIQKITKNAGGTNAGGGAGGTTATAPTPSPQPNVGTTAADARAQNLQYAIDGITSAKDSATAKMLMDIAAKNGFTLASDTLALQAAFDAAFPPASTPAPADPQPPPAAPAPPVVSTPTPVVTAPAVPAPDTAPVSTPTAAPLPVAPAPVPPIITTGSGTGTTGIVDPTTTVGTGGNTGATGTGNGTGTGVGGVGTGINGTGGTTTNTGSGGSGTGTNTGTGTGDGTGMTLPKPPKKPQFINLFGQGGNNMQQQPTNSVQVTQSSFNPATALAGAALGGTWANSAIKKPKFQEATLADLNAATVPLMQQNNDMANNARAAQRSATGGMSTGELYRDTISRQQLDKNIAQVGAKNKLAAVGSHNNMAAQQYGADQTQFKNTLAGATLGAQIGGNPGAFFGDAGSVTTGTSAGTNNAGGVLQSLNSSPNTQGFDWQSMLKNSGLSMPDFLKQLNFDPAKVKIDVNTGALVDIGTNAAIAGGGAYLLQKAGVSPAASAAVAAAATPYVADGLSWLYSQATGA